MCRCWLFVRLQAHEKLPSFRDDVIVALLALGTGALASLAISWPAGLVTFLIAEGQCRGGYMCELGAALWRNLSPRSSASRWSQESLGSGATNRIS